MQRRLSLVAGVVLLATTFATLLTAARLTPLDRLGTWLVGTGGSLFVVAGWRDELPYGDGAISWYRLAGLGNVLVGIGFPLSLVSSRLGPAASTFDLVVFAAVAVGGLVLAVVGLDVARGGRYVSVETDE